MYKDVLVYFDESRKTAGMQSAMSLARAVDAHLTGLYVKSLWPLHELHALQSYDVMSLAALAVQ